MDLAKNTYQVLENVAQATQKANRSKKFSRSNSCHQIC